MERACAGIWTSLGCSAQSLRRAANQRGMHGHIRTAGDSLRGGWRPRESYRFCKYATAGPQCRGCCGRAPRCPFQVRISASVDASVHGPCAVVQCVCAQCDGTGSGMELRERECCGAASCGTDDRHQGAVQAGRASREGRCKAKSRVRNLLSSRSLPHPQQLPGVSYRQKELPFLAARLPAGGAHPNTSLCTGAPRFQVLSNCSGGQGLSLVAHQWGRLARTVHTVVQRGERV